MFLLNHPLAPHSHLCAEVQNRLGCTKTKPLFSDVTETPENSSLYLPKKSSLQARPFQCSSIPCGNKKPRRQKYASWLHHWKQRGMFNSSTVSPLRCTNSKQLTHDSNDPPAQTAQPQSVVSVSSLNSLSLHQTEVIGATCPSHMLASTLLSSRHSSGHRVENQFLVGFSTCTSPSYCSFFTLCHVTEKSWLRNC